LKSNEDFLRKALQDLLKSLPGRFECDHFGHSTKTFHSFDEDCPHVLKIEEAIKNAQEVLTSAK
jgi:hypothetical protein